MFTARGASFGRRRIELSSKRALQIILDRRAATRFKDIFGRSLAARDVASKGLERLPRELVFTAESGGTAAAAAAAAQLPQHACIIQTDFETRDSIHFPKISM